MKINKKLLCRLNGKQKKLILQKMEKEGVIFDKEIKKCTSEELEKYFFEVIKNV